MRPLCLVQPYPIETLCRGAQLRAAQPKGAAMYDLLDVLLGAGTILLMAAYAELCERI
jgi:hypothetical protein